MSILNLDCIGSSPAPLGLFQCFCLSSLFMSSCFVSFIVTDFFLITLVNMPHYSLKREKQNDIKAEFLGPVSHNDKQHESLMQPQPLNLLCLLAFVCLQFQHRCQSCTQNKCQTTPASSNGILKFLRQNLQQE